MGYTILNTRTGETFLPGGIDDSYYACEKHIRIFSSKEEEDFPLVGTIYQNCAFGDKLIIAKA